MIKTRIIPILNLQGSTVVKSVQFADHRMVGDGAANVKLFTHRMADEMFIVDINAHKTRSISLETTKRLAKDCMMPLTIGGGIVSLKNADDLFRAGADKVVVNTAFFEVPNLTSQIAAKYGTQALVVSIDYKKDKNRRICYSRSAKTNTGVLLEDAVCKAQNEGAGEILINSIDNDGMMQGYDLDALNTIVNLVEIPIIIAGGCGSKQDCVAAIKAGASAVAGGSVFFWIGESIITIKEFMKEHDIEVRIL